VTAPVQQAAGDAAAEVDLRPRRRGRRRALAAAVVVVVVVVGGGIAVAVSRPWPGPAPAPSPGPDPTSLAPVTRQALAAQTTVSGTLGYAGSYSVFVPAGAAGSSPAGSTAQAGGGGTFTALPAVGQVVRQGQSLYAVNGAPVTLLYGSVPAYRSLSEGMTGIDVRQLNADLVALGEAGRAGLDPDSSYFGPATATALDKLQDRLGLTVTGSLPLGQAAFLPAAARIATVSATLGAPAQPGAAVLQATSTTRQATAEVDATQLPDVTPGAPVSITLPDNQATPGVVTSVGTVAGGAPSGSGSSGSGSGGAGSSGASVSVDISLSDPAAAGTLDQAPVEVSITTATVPDALAVPVDALLAQPGGYAVEVAGADGARHLVTVTLGLFDDAAGLVQVSGPGLAAGQRVVVPQI
jgi:HlyD family secretion protein/Putative peptidoglycan binding domain